MEATLLSPALSMLKTSDDIRLIEDEQFDFNLSLTPKNNSSTFRSIRSSDGLDGDDEVFIGPVNHKELCVSTALDQQEKENAAEKPLSPLTAQEMAELCVEAQRIACQIQISVSQSAKKTPAPRNHPTPLSLDVPKTSSLGDDTKSPQFSPLKCLDFNLSPFGAETSKVSPEVATDNAVVPVTESAPAKSAAKKPTIVKPVKKLSTPSENKYQRRSVPTPQKSAFVPPPQKSALVPPAKPISAVSGSRAERGRGGHSGGSLRGGRLPPPQTKPSNTEKTQTKSSKSGPLQRSASFKLKRPSTVTRDPPKQLSESMYEPSVNTSTTSSSSESSTGTVTEKPTSSTGLSKLQSLRVKRPSGDKKLPAVPSFTAQPASKPSIKSTLTKLDFNRPAAFQRGTTAQTAKPGPMKAHTRPQSITSQSEKKPTLENNKRTLSDNSLPPESSASKNRFSLAAPSKGPMTKPVALSSVPQITQPARNLQRPSGSRFSTSDSSQLQRVVQKKRLLSEAVDGPTDLKTPHNSSLVSSATTPVLCSTPAAKRQCSLPTPHRLSSTSSVLSGKGGSVSSINSDDSPAMNTRTQTSVMPQANSSLTKCIPKRSFLRSPTKRHK